MVFLMALAFSLSYSFDVEKADITETGGIILGKWYRGCWKEEWRMWN